MLDTMQSCISSISRNFDGETFIEELYHAEIERRMYSIRRQKDHFWNEMAANFLQAGYLTRK